jgi:hypothetical protein
MNLLFLDTVELAAKSVGTDGRNRANYKSIVTRHFRGDFTLFKRQFNDVKL